MPPSAFENAMMLRGGRKAVWSPPLIYTDRPLGKPSPADPRAYPFRAQLDGEERDPAPIDGGRRRSWLKIRPVRPTSDISLVGDIPLWSPCTVGCPECERPSEEPFAYGARMSGIVDAERFLSLDDREQISSGDAREKYPSGVIGEWVSSRVEEVQLPSSVNGKRVSSHEEEERVRSRGNSGTFLSSEKEEQGRSRGGSGTFSSREKEERFPSGVNGERISPREKEERAPSGVNGETIPSREKEEPFPSRVNEERVSSREKEEQVLSRANSGKVSSREKEEQVLSRVNSGTPSPREKEERVSSREDRKRQNSRDNEKRGLSGDSMERAKSRGDEERGRSRDASDRELVSSRAPQRPPRPDDRERGISSHGAKERDPSVSQQRSARSADGERAPSRDGEELAASRVKQRPTRPYGNQSATQLSLTAASDLAALRLALKFSNQFDASSLHKSSLRGRAVSSLLDAYPEYSTTTRIDELRATEYSYLDKQRHVYLDYTGSGLAATAQHRAHRKRMAKVLCGNPHSVNPTSESATLLIEQARARVLEYLNAPPDEYMVIFTQNATAAARLVGEAYPFSRRTRLVMSTDNHNSVNGLREFARRGRSRVVYVPAEPPCLRIDPELLMTVLSRRGGWEAVLGPGSGMAGRRGLFAYPAQSNFSGVRHPLSWVTLAQQMGYDVLLDAAAYLPTGTVDLSVVQPEFLLVSWYKLFGYPTGVGCLVARRSAVARLSRPWFSGGTIKAVSVGIPWHEMAPNETAFEDGTLNFLSIPDVSFGLDWLAYIGMDLIDTRVRCLTGWFLDRLRRLEHSDGSRMALIYGPTDTRSRGGTVCFNFLDVRGNVIDERLVAIESAEAKISLRTGCFCNPGLAENALGLTVKRLRPLYWTKTDSLDDLIEVIGLPSGGAIRVSFGVASNAADVDRFFEFAEKTYQDRINTSAGLPPRDRC